MTTSSPIVRVSSTSKWDPNQLYGMSRKLKEIYQKREEDETWAILRRKPAIL